MEGFAVRERFLEGFRAARDRYEKGTLMMKARAIVLSLALVTGLLGATSAGAWCQERLSTPADPNGIVRITAADGDVCDRTATSSRRHIRHRRHGAALPRLRRGPAPEAGGPRRRMM